MFLAALSVPNGVDEGVMVVAAEADMERSAGRGDSIVGADGEGEGKTDVSFGDSEGGDGESSGPLSYSSSGLDAMVEMEPELELCRDNLEESLHGIK